MIIDTHCHIDMYQNPVQVLNDCENKGIVVISMTNLPSHFELGINHFKNKRKVRQALGFHPLLISANNISELIKFKKLIHKTSYVGEVGLDFSKEGISTKDLQLSVFQDILSVVKNSEQEKILSLHSRSAEREVLSLLMKFNIKYAIFHWYSGDIKLISEIIDAGYYFSINPAMAKSRKGNEIINKLPLEKILIESDGPFIDLDRNPILPSQLDEVYVFLAKKYKISLNEMHSVIKSNFYHLAKSLK